LCEQVHTGSHQTLVTLPCTAFCCRRFVKKFVIDYIILDIMTQATGDARMPDEESDLLQIKPL